LNVLDNYVAVVMITKYFYVGVRIHNVKS